MYNNTVEYLMKKCFVHWYRKVFKHTLKQENLGKELFIVYHDLCKKGECMYIYIYKICRLSLLQGILQTQESNLGLLHCKQILYTAELPGKQICMHVCVDVGFPGGSAGKESTCNVGGLGLISGSGRSPGEGHGKQLSVLP